MPTDNENSIKETLGVIRKALEEDYIIEEDNNQTILLNQLIKKDGTIKIIDNGISKNDIRQIFENKLSDIVDRHIENWLERNIPKHINNYFSKKEK